jgi:hypothetical protein
MDGSDVLAEKADERGCTEPRKRTPITTGAIPTEKL